MTKATYTNPFQVATQVKSLTQSMVDAGKRNSRFTLSSGHGAFLSEIVVLYGLPRMMPWRLMRQASGFGYAKP